MKHWLHSAKGKEGRRGLNKEVSCVDYSRQGQAKCLNNVLWRQGRKKPTEKDYLGGDIQPANGSISILFQALKKKRREEEFKLNQQYFLFSFS